MKTLLVILLSTFSLFSFSAKFLPAKLIYKDGKQIEGYSKYPKITDKTVDFKTTLDGEKQEIQSDELKTIILQEKDGGYELDYVKTYQYYSTTKVAGPFWMSVIQRGYATLYAYSGTGYYSMSASGGFSYGSMPASTYFVCKRENEEQGMIIAEYINATTINGNAYFKKFGQQYFSDYPELAEKIKTQEYKYKQVYEVVKEYNDWKKSTM